MSATVSCKITQKLEVSRVNTLSTGVGAGNMDVRLPASVAGGSTSYFSPTTLACAKAWARALSLAASTPVSLDVASLAGGEGDASFASVVLVDVRNNEAVGSGRNLTVGGDGLTTEFYDPIGTSGSKAVIPPGCSRQFFTREAAGWATGTRHTLKLDPGTNPVSCTVTIAGS